MLSYYDAKGIKICTCVNIDFKLNVANKNMQYITSQH